jgi:predicted  nucleic acid-binding Zn ribbon protein
MLNKLYSLKKKSYYYLWVVGGWDLKQKRLSQFGSTCQTCNPGHEIGITS